MERFYFMLMLIAIIALLVLYILEGWVFYIPEDVVMVYGYNDKDDNGNPHYTVECFNYNKEKVETYTLEKDEYDKLLSDEHNFYKIHRKGKMGKRLFFIGIDDKGVLCD